MTHDEVFAPIARYVRTYRELRVPVVPDGKGRYGRLDFRRLTAADKAPQEVEALARQLFAGQ